MEFDSRIRQFIFAGPKPGLSAAAFQSYWINFHAVEFAAKIPQIQQYLIAPRIPFDHVRAIPFFEGVAEIWLKDENEQIASMQSPEFLNGARADEPRWAAFWQTLVIDTEAHVSGGPDNARTFTNIYVLTKRKHATSLDVFRNVLLKDRAGTIKNIPALKRYVAAPARSALYGLGEPRFDAVEVLSFGTPDEARSALASNDMNHIVSGAWASVVDPACMFLFLGQENWIIAPGER